MSIDRCVLMMRLQAFDIKFLFKNVCIRARKLQIFAALRAAFNLQLKNVIHQNWVRRGLCRILRQKMVKKCKSNW